MTNTQKSKELLSYLDPPEKKIDTQYILMTFYIVYLKQLNCSQYKSTLLLRLNFSYFLPFCGAGGPSRKFYGFSESMESKIR